MQGSLADFEHAWRLYRRTPGASPIAVIGFASALAAVGAFVSLYVDLILRPHAGFVEAGRIVTLGRQTEPGVNASRGCNAASGQVA